MKGAGKDGRARERGSPDNDDTGKAAAARQVRDGRCATLPWLVHVQCTSVGLGYHGAVWRGVERSARVRLKGQRRRLELSRQTNSNACCHSRSEPHAPGRCRMVSRQMRHTDDKIVGPCSAFRTSCLRHQRQDDGMARVMTSQPAQARSTGCHCHCHRQCHHPPPSSLF